MAQPMTENEIASVIIKSVKSGGKIICIGNGGSAAEAHHFVGECLGKFETEGKPIPAITLNDISAITAIANDYIYSDIFVRQLEALGKKEDVLIILSTSGTSGNVVKAREYAESIGMKVVEFPTNSQLDTSTASTQEVHLEMIHNIMRLIEGELR